MESYVDWTFERYHHWRVNRQKILDHLERLKYVFNIEMTYDEWNYNYYKRYNRPHYIELIE